MHIPDNYLSPSTCAFIGAAMIPVWNVSIRKVKEEVSKARIPLLGIGAAYSFLIMMFNVPLPGGTTGHVVGGTLLAILLGPYSACISLTVALLLQALLFQDGGIIAFGANCFNMAFIMPFLGYFVYKFIKDRIKTVNGEYAGIVLGSYVGINFAALAAAIEFGIQPVLFKSAEGKPLYCPYSLSQSIPAMVFSHLTVAGVLEVVFTVAVISFIKRVSPGIVYEGAKQKLKPVYSLILLLICLSPLGLIATGTAWGEWGSDEIQKVSLGGTPLGYLPEGMKNGFSFNALMSDYALKGIPDVAGYILSAVAGTAILVIVFKVLSTFSKKSEKY
ncbi:MAG TPA: cobalt transporter CbiM [Clostridia bacterium]